MSASIATEIAVPSIAQSIVLLLQSDLVRRQDSRGRLSPFYGQSGRPFLRPEVLSISPEAVNLNRMTGGNIIPLLDSHQMAGINNALGRFR